MVAHSFTKTTVSTIDSDKHDLAGCETKQVFFKYCLAVQSLFLVFYFPTTLQLKHENTLGQSRRQRKYLVKTNEKRLWPKKNNTYSNNTK